MTHIIIQKHRLCSVLVCNKHRRIVLVSSGIDIIIYYIFSCTSSGLNSVSVRGLYDIMY